MEKPNDPSTAGGDKFSNRKTFSVSKGFSDIHTILNALPENEASRFICEAIRFYHQYKSNPNWMGEQLQSVIAMTTQLQQAMAGLGGMGFPAPTPYPNNVQQGSNIPVNPLFPMGYGGAPQQPISQQPLQQQPLQQQPVENPVANDQTHQNEVTNTELHSSDSDHNLVTEEVASSSEETMAVEPENRYRSSTSSESSAKQSGDPAPKPRRRSGMASSLVSKSMGVKED